MERKIIIGSRGSDLALWQANHVKDSLEKLGLPSEIKIIKTQGDKIQHLSFDKLEGKGFFTKEIEEALLKCEIDLAVHSHKDLPTESPDELIIACVSDRENPSDLLLINQEAIDLTQKFSLKKNALVGTSSTRRKCQLLSFRNDLQIEDLRGNVPTRVQKLKDKKYDAILIAFAGVNRLNLDLSSFFQEKISPTELIPAPAQGVLALQIRKNDKKLFDQLQKLNNFEVAQTISVERKILNLFSGGCQTPVGVFCKKENGKFVVWTAKGKTADDFPVRIFEEAETCEGLAENVVKKFKKLKPTSVFVTREVFQECYFVKALEKNGFSVFGKSLLKISQVPISKVEKTDWIFFSSKNAVFHFFSQSPEISKNVKFGVIGKGTESALKLFDKEAGFCGDKFNTVEVGKDFAKLVENQSVLFPISQNSLKTVEKQLLPNTKIIDLIVYQNEPVDDFTLIDAEILVFTSPSNVEAFFQKQKINPNQKVIAIGTATGKKLAEFGVSNYKLPYSSNEISLVEAIFGI
ncbi:hydroxymethylbilane synthase [bacterium]|nr:hydroxymethylbilane synthase [bacterium]